MANPHGFTDEEMAALSDEERAALEEEDESTASDTPAAETPEADPAPPESEPAPDPAAAETPAADDEPAAETPAPTEPQVATEPAPEPEPEPEPVAATPAAEPAPTEPPRDFETELQDYDAKEIAIAKRYDEGEISHLEAKREEIALRNERDAVVSTRDQVLARESSEEAMWQHQLKIFHAEHAEYAGTDLAGRSRHAALREAIQDLSTAQNLRTRTHAWFLEEAHKQVNQVFGAGEPGAPPTATKPDDVPVNPSAAKPGETPPKTLGGLPAAADDDPAADEFSAIDSLQGIELEQALNKLTPEQADRYLDTSKLHH